MQFVGDARYQTGTREHDLPIPESTATLICFQTGADGRIRGSRLLNVQDGTSGGDFPIPESTATQVFFPGGHLRRTRDLCLLNSCLISKVALAEAIFKFQRAQRSRISPSGLSLLAIFGGGCVGRQLPGAEFQNSTPRQRRRLF